MPVAGSISQTTARLASTVMPRSEALLLEPMPTYRRLPSALAASALVQWWLMSDGSSVTVTGGPLACIWPSL